MAAAAKSKFKGVVHTTINQELLVLLHWQELPRKVLPQPTNSSSDRSSKKDNDTSCDTTSRSSSERESSKEKSIDDLRTD